MGPNPIPQNMIMKKIEKLAEREDYYLPLEISFLPMNPKKGPWSASSSFFFLKYSCSSLAFCLWNSKVITPLSATRALGVGVGGGGGGEVTGVDEIGADGGGDGGTGFTGGGATGLLKGPSAWEFLIVKMVVGLVAENLKVDDEDEQGEDEEEDKGLRNLMHGKEDDDATDIFSMYNSLFLVLLCTWQSW